MVNRSIMIMNNQPEWQEHACGSTKSVKQRNQARPISSGVLSTIDWNHMACEHRLRWVEHKRPEVCRSTPPYRPWRRIVRVKSLLKAPENLLIRIWINASFWFTESIGITWWQDKVEVVPVIFFLLRMTGLLKVSHPNYSEDRSIPKVSTTCWEEQ